MKTSFVVLVLLGAVDFHSQHAGVNAAQLERYFPHHSWEKVNPAEFVRNLNQEVEAEKQMKKNGAAANSQNQKQSRSQRKDDSMIQQEQEEGNFTAHEMAIQLREAMQSTLADLGVDYKSHDDTQNDLVQVTADDFDNYDHLNDSNRGHPKKAKSGEEKDELNKQKVAHIARMEQKLTERINTLLNSSHRTDSDEGELEDVLLEVKPITKLNVKLAQAHEKIKEAPEVKKTQKQTFTQLDGAFEGLKRLVDQRKQQLAQLRESRRHHHHRREAQEEQDLMEAAPRDFIPRHASKQPSQTHMSQQIDMGKFQKKFGDKAESFKAAHPEEMERRQAPQQSERAAARIPHSEPMQGEGYVKPHGLPDPRDSFSIPTHELRKEKKEELEKIDEEVEQEKTDKEIAAISRGAKRVVDYNKKKLMDTEKQFNKQQRKDILTRQETHKKLKKLNRRDKMEKDLEEQREVENTIKRADQITAAVKSFENRQFSKEVVAEAEDDIINKEDKENEKLEKQFKKELEKEERAARKKHLKEKEERARHGWDRPEKFVYPEEAEHKEKKSKKIQQPASLVEQSMKVEDDEDGEPSKTEEKEEEKGESEEKAEEKEKESTSSSSSDQASEEDQQSEDKAEEDKESKVDKKKDEKKTIKLVESDDKAAETKDTEKKSKKKTTNSSGSKKEQSKAKAADDEGEADEKEFNSFAQHAMDALQEAKKLELEFDDLQKED